MIGAQLTRSRLLARVLHCVGLIAALTSASARAEAGLTLHEGATCLRRDLLEAQLEPGTTRTLEDETISLRIEGSLEDPRAADIRLTRDGELLAERSFAPGPPRCNDFHAALAVTIGIMLRSLSSPVPVPVPEPVHEPVREPVRAPSPRPPVVFTHTRERPPLWITPRITGALGWGVAASRQRGAALDLSISARHWVVRAGVLALSSVEQSFRNVDAGYRSRPLAGTLDACARLVHTRTFYADLCGGLLLGRLQVRGSSGGELASEAHHWAALRAELLLALSLSGPLHLVASVAPIQSLAPVEVTANAPDGEQVDRQKLAPTGVLLGFGLAYEFLRQGSKQEGHR